MPHYRERPLSILRNTHGSQPFFQKHFLEQSTAGLRVVKIPNADKDPDFVVCDSPEGLLHLAQVGAVELHSWGAVMPKPDAGGPPDLRPRSRRRSRLSTAARRGAGDPQAHEGPGARELDQDHRRQGPARGGAAVRAATRLGHGQGFRAQRHAVHGAPGADHVHVQDRRKESQEQDLRRLSTQRLRRHGRRRVFTALAAGCGRVDARDLGRNRRGHPRHTLQPAQRARTASRSNARTRGRVTGTPNKS